DLNSVKLDCFLRCHDVSPADPDVATLETDEDVAPLLAEGSEFRSGNGRRRRIARAGRRHRGVAPFEDDHQARGRRLRVRRGVRGGDGGGDEQGEHGPGPAPYLPGFGSFVSGGRIGLNSPFPLRSRFLLRSAGSKSTLAPPAGMSTFAVQRMALTTTRRK